MEEIHLRKMIVLNAVVVLYILCLYSISHLTMTRRNSTSLLKDCKNNITGPLRALSFARRVADHPLVDTWELRVWIQSSWTLERLL